VAALIEAGDSRGLIDVVMASLTAAARERDDGLTKEKGDPNDKL